MIKISKKKFESLSVWKKVLFVMYATLIFLTEKAYTWLKSKNFANIGNNVGMYFLGVSGILGVWSIWSLFNIIGNNLSSPQSISKYNMFVVLSDLLAK